MRHRPALALAAALVAVPAVAAAPAVDAPDAVPEQVPDRGPVLSEFLDRGELITTPASRRAPSTKQVDGDPSDWIGEPSRIGGTSRFDAGEHIHSDFLFDAYGADDGGDRDRWEQFASTFQVDNRTRRLDNVLRTSGSQLGVPEPIGAPDEYGDHNPDLTVGDLTEVRWAAQADRLHLLTRFTNLTGEAADRLVVLVLADTGRLDEDGWGRGMWFLGTEPLTTERFDTAIRLDRHGATGYAVRDGQITEIDPSAFEVAVDPTGWTNALEASLPANLLAHQGAIDVAVVAGAEGPDGFEPYNVAYRRAEPIDIWNDRLQAFALLDGTADDFSSGPIALADLRRGRTDHVRPGAGYHERTFRSSEEISREHKRDGIHQPYGLFVPTSYDPVDDELTPLTFWLHYRGGKAHSGAAINPRLITQLGEERGNVVVTPHARGTSEWYVTDAHQDVFEVFDDVHALFDDIDPQRRYLSGYSMGGYGTYLFGLLYPDLFAGGYVSSGAMTQGMWAGGGPDDEPDPFFDQGWVEANDGDARAQLTYRILENGRHFPLAIDHGTSDELVPVTGVQRMGARLAELGYRYQLTTFLGYEHFSQAVMDEWVDGARYLDDFAVPENPAHVTYKVVPALVHALNTVRAPEGADFDFDPDGAWWVDDITPRSATADDPSTYALVDAVSHALPREQTLPLPVTGAASPPGHSTPYVRHGLDWLDDPLADAAEPANGFTLELTDVAEVTLDGTRMGLDPTAPIDATITSDGPAIVRILFADGSELRIEAS